MLNCTELQGQNLWWKTHPNLVNKKSLPSVLSKNSNALSWSGNSIRDFLLRLHSGDIVNRTPTFPFFGSEYRVEELLQELMFMAAVARPAAFIATPPFSFMMWRLSRIVCKLCSFLTKVSWLFKCSASGFDWASRMKRTHTSMKMAGLLDSEMKEERVGFDYSTKKAKWE